MSHLYWGFDCKTQGCKTQIVVGYGGLYDPQSAPLCVDMTPNPVERTCHKCKRMYSYFEREAIQIISEQAPPENLPKANSVCFQARGDLPNEQKNEDE
jgi:hypothetical protein